MHSETDKTQDTSAVCAADSKPASAHLYAAFVGQHCYRVHRIPSMGITSAHKVYVDRISPGGKSITLNGKPEPITWRVRLELLPLDSPEVAAWYAAQRARAQEQAAYRESDAFKAEALAGRIVSYIDNRTFTLAEIQTIADALQTLGFQP